MSSDLLSIARSGVRAARIQLDVTAQNITNASSEGYVRRSVSTEEVMTPGYVTQNRDVSLSGVRVSGVVRNADAFRQAEVRRTNADTSRFDTEVTGLEDVQASLENAGIYSAITGFESSLTQLAQDPTNSSMRATVIAAAQTMSNSFNIADNQLTSVAKGQQNGAADGVDQINAFAAELAKLNGRLSRMADSNSDRTGLLDQRDMLLQKMSDYADVTTSFSANGTVDVTLGGASGAPLVTGQTAKTLSMATADDGTISFAVDGGTVSISSGSLAGEQQVLAKIVETRKGIDDLAKSIVTTVNKAQGNGINLGGTTGVDLMSGDTAASIAMATTDGAAIATAASGAKAGSRDISNLTALRNALTTTNPAGTMDDLLYEASSAVQGRTTTRDALKTISDAAKTALSAQSGVDLDTEAINLTRFQQAFQASGRVMQVASTIFDSILALK